MAVRIAYELNMHLIDASSNQDNNNQWCEKEERRRTWWAIWEMDVFASVIRRCPTAIDWSENETLLPAEDERWQRGEPQKSCRLPLDPLQRFRCLEATKSQSSTAWFIVINSLMKDAQKITSPLGVDSRPDTSAQDRATISWFEVKNIASNATDKASSFRPSVNRLQTIQNALQCTVMALPTSLKYRNQALNFGSREMDRESASSLRVHHSVIYSIHSMVQLTKLMIHKYYIFRNGVGAVSSKNDRHTTSHDPHHTLDGQAFKLYLESSDEIVSLISRSYEEHYRYVNPFLANTIWVAGAVQLLHRELSALDASERDLTNSKLELLSMTYDRFVRFWSMSTSLQKSLVVGDNEVDNLQPDAQRSHSNLSDTQTTHGDSPAKRRLSNVDVYTEKRAGSVTNEAGRQSTFDGCKFDTTLFRSSYFAY
jgi:hypothetical protein